MGLALKKFDVQKAFVDLFVMIKGSLVDNESILLVGKRNRQEGEKWLKFAGIHNAFEVSEEASENQVSNEKATEWHESILLPALQCQVWAWNLRVKLYTV